MARQRETRARVVECIRRRCNTVRDIAATLGLTENAVRFHIASLARSGTIRHMGVARSGHAGKPPVVYGLTEAAEQLQSRAYAQVLAACVEELRERVPRKELRRVMQSTGARMAAEFPKPKGGFNTRVRGATAVLDALGGVVSVGRTAGTTMVEGYSCPLALVVTREPAACAVMQTLLSELIGARVTEMCDHAARPRCRFLVIQADAA